MIERLWHDQSGQALTEYSLVMGVVASMVLSLAVLFRDELGDMLTTLGASLVTVVSNLD